MLNLTLAPLDELLLVHAAERSLLLVGLLVSIELVQMILAAYSLLSRFISVGTLVSFAAQELELRCQLGSHIALLFLSLLVDFQIGSLVLAIH